MQQLNSIRRISSSLVLWWYKRSGLWLLGTAAVLCIGIMLFLVLRGRLEPGWLLAPAAITVIGVVYIRKFVLPLADEVFDEGDALVVRRGADSVRIALPDIERIDYSLVFDPPRITLHTRQGESIAFMPYLTPGMCFFREHPLVAELAKRCAGSRSS
jgi:hypothetical protein